MYDNDLKVNEMSITSQINPYKSKFSDETYWLLINLLNIKKYWKVDRMFRSKKLMTC